MTDSLLDQYKKKLFKALKHLDYSYQKIKILPTSLAQLDEEGLETWESFSARFSRVVDLFLTKYVKAFVLKNDPGFEGSLRDFVNQGEKLGIIDNAEKWIQLREVRNITVHEYADEDLAIFFNQIKTEAPHLLKLKDILQ